MPVRPAQSSRIRTIPEPLIHWKENRRLEMQGRYQAQANAANLVENRQQGPLEINRDLLRFNRAPRRIELQGLPVTQAQENRRLHNNRFKAGRLTLVDLLEAQAVSQPALTRATGEQF